MKILRNFLYQTKTFINDLFRYPNLGMQDSNYDLYWQEKKKGTLGMPNSFQIARGRWIASKVEDGASVVDVGCGDGSVLFVMLGSKRIQAMGLDVSPFILNFLKSKNIDAQSFDLNSVDAAKNVPINDHALVLEVLEHLAQPEKFLLDLLARVNKSVFISIPNTGYLHHRLRLLFGRFPLQWRAHPSEHLRFWTLSDFHWWTNQLGIESRTKIYCYAGIPILNRVWPALFAQGIIAEIKKQEILD